MKKASINIFLLILPAIFFFPRLLDSAIPAPERAGLIAFYNAAEGDGWKCRLGWKTPPLHSDGFAAPGTEGSWFGVTVQGDHVVKLVCTGNYLKGHLDAGIENLTELTELDLRYNELSGPLPAQLGNLSKLERLYLTSNFFSGSIPGDLGRLTRLTRLNLAINLFRGALPPELGSCVNLEHLWLETNIISSSVPSSFANLTGLKTLNLGNNRVNGDFPAFIGALVNLEVIELSSNDLSGGIPSALGALSRLRTLKIDNNKLSGLIPNSLLQLTALTDLDIGTNCLTSDNDALITWLNSLDPDWQYTQHQCNETHYQVRLLSPVGFETWRAGSVQTIYWQGDDSFSINIEYSTDNGATWKLIAVTEADSDAYNWTVPNTPSSQCKVRIRPGYNIVSSNNFIIYNGVPRHEREALKALYNTTNGAGWKDKTGWKTAPLFTDGFAMPGTEGGWYGVIVRDNHVYELQFLYNNLSGPIPRAIENLTELKHFSIHYNNLNGGIPEETGGLNRLTHIYLESNQLSGPVPAVLGGLKNLQHLHLGRNRLSGAIPPELGDCSSLQHIWLETNQISGAIPNSFSKLSNLQRLCLHTNQVGGSIPSFLGELSKLEYIELMNNQFSGTIPANLGQLTDMKTLWLNNNLLSGEIPATLTNLAKLTQFDISANCLYAPPNTALQTWLNNHDPDWSTTQTKCGAITPSLTLTAPNGGETWFSGAHHSITWRYAGPVGNIRIEYSVNNGSTWSIINASAPNTGIYDWLVPFHASNQCRVQIRGAAADYIHDISDKVFTISDTRPAIQLSRNAMTFNALKSGLVSGPQNVWLTNKGAGTLNWTAVSNVPWLSVSPGAGKGDALLSIAVNASGLTPGGYFGIISISEPNAVNSPVVINVRLIIRGNNQDAAPFGEFATPTDHSSVRGGAPFTGWVLDDIGVSNVKIYREEGKKLICVGDAVFVEGARPDVEAAFPDYPNNYKAGWGYMMLTNMLPNGGNGVFRFHAIAEEYNGKKVDLGVKTITVNNTQAVKPFGAIDTPTQGGVASGTGYINWAWVLTPPPNKIPVNGETLHVWVDGENLGNPSYNHYRPDVASLFPHHLNAAGASGFLRLDATRYKSGMHSIQWTATDNAGNTDGIGSRYFYVLNSASNRGYDALDPAVADLPNDFLPIQALTGFQQSVPITLHPDEHGAIHLTARELEPIQLHLNPSLSGNETPPLLPENNPNLLRGALISGASLRELPPGSSLNPQKGIFYWQPGPGFSGEYRFIFTVANETGDIQKKEIIILITPKFSPEEPTPEPRNE